MKIFKISNLIEKVKYIKNKNVSTTNNTVTDALIKNIANGNTEAFERFYKSTDEIVYKYILSFLDDADDAREVMIRTYVEVRNSAVNYKANGRPMGWVFTIARTFSVDKLQERGNAAKHYKLLCERP